MNLIIMMIVGLLISAGAAYLKGTSDTSKRLAQAALVEEKAKLEASLKRTVELQRIAQQDAVATRKEFLAKKEEADGLRLELEKRGKVAACKWTPSQRDRMRQIRIGSKPPATRQ